MTVTKRAAQALLIAVLGLCVWTGATYAQDAPAAVDAPVAVDAPAALEAPAAPAAPAKIDRTDPVAVVKAYTKACEEFDAATFIDLVTGDEALVAALRRQTEQMARGVAEMRGQRGFLDVFAEYSFLPMGGKAPSVVEKQGGDEGEMVVTATEAEPRKKTFVLKKMPDGTWKVDLEQSILRTTGAEKSILVSSIRQDPRAGRGDDRNEPWRRRQRLQQLASKLLNYIQQRDRMVPGAEGWMDELEDYALDPALFDDLADEKGVVGVALNAQVAGTELPNDWQVRRSTVLLYECAGAERNAYGNPNEELADRAEGSGPLMVAFADGQVRSIPLGMSIEDASREERLQQVCARNVQRICRALRDYARDHEGMLPPADQWCGVVEEYVDPEQLKPEIFQCPSRPDLEYGYAINKALAGQDVRDFPDHEKHILILPAIAGIRNEAREVPKECMEGFHHGMQGMDMDAKPFVHVGTLAGNSSNVIEGRPYFRP